MGCPQGDPSPSTPEHWQHWQWGQARAGETQQESPGRSYHRRSAVGRPPRQHVRLTPWWRVPPRFSMCLSPCLCHPSQPPFFERGCSLAGARGRVVCAVVHAQTHGALVHGAISARALNAPAPLARSCLVSRTQRSVAAVGGESAVHDSVGSGQRSSLRWRGPYPNAMGAPASVGSLP